VKVRVNGEETDLDRDVTVAALVDRLGLSSRRVAVELNRVAVRRETWADVVIAESDEVEIVQFVGGG